MEHADAETLTSWADDPTFCAHAGWRAGAPLADTLTWWRQAIAEPDPKLCRLLAVSGGDAVGYVDLHGETEGVRELGYVIGPSSRWGHGLGTAAAHAGLHFGFEQLHLDRIWAEAVEANEASVRVLRRIGMREIGWGADERFLDQPSRYLTFEMLRSEWRGWS